MKILDDTLLIFTSDHGEALGGEHGIYYDHMDAYEQVAHVPLLIRHPGRIEPRVIDAMVQHIDFAPTILEAFGMDVPPVFQGRSLWPLLEGKVTDHYDAVFTNQGLWSAQRAMRTRDWTLMKTISRGMVLEAAPVELYRRSADPEEAHDLAAQHPDVLAALEERYHRWLESQLEDRPDPLRVTAQGPTAWKTVEARYRQHVESARRQAMTPADRAAIDHRPGDRRPRGSRT
jgi:arylsulfatase A-like enzyme